jgi:hypothetical protein
MANLRALDDNALEKFHESGALRSGAVLPVVDAVCTNDGIDGCVGVSGKIGLPLGIVGGQSRQGCQVPTSRTSRGDNEIGVPPELVDVGACPRDRCFDISHLARPAMLRAGPVLQ